MAAEWKTLSLREAGVTLIDCDHRTPPASDNGYPYVAIPQLRGGRIDFSAARRITPEHFAEWTRKAKPSENDVVLSRRCNPGETAFVPTEAEFALGQNLVLLRADGVRVYPRFLRWLVRSPEWWQQIAKFLNVGAVFDSLRCADVPRFELRIPPLDDQRAIDRILGALDDKIELNRRMTETLLETARARYRSTFLDGDRAGQGSRLGKVGDLCTAIYSGGTPDTRVPAYWDGDLPWLSSGETRSTIIVDTERRITETGVTNSSTRLAPALSTVVAAAGQGSTRGQTSLLAFDSYVNQSVVVLTADPLTSSPYHLFFDLERRYEEFRRVSDAHSSRGSLTTKLLGQLDAMCPPRDSVRRFTANVAPLVDRAVLCRRESGTLAALRDTLLPKLISGELRVGEAERFMDADS